MAMKEKIDLKLYVTIYLGGINKTTGKPNPTNVEGYFLGTKEVTTAYGPAKVHVFQTAEGNVSLFGKTNSNRLLTSDLIGQMVKLTFTGMSKPKKGRQAAYEFKLAHDEDNRLDTEAISAATLAPEEEPELDDSEVNEELSDAPAFVAPKARAIAPTAEQQAKVRALLGRK